MRNQAADTKNVALDRLKTAIFEQTLVREWIRKQGTQSLYADALIKTGGALVSIEEVVQLCFSDAHNSD